LFFLQHKIVKKKKKVNKIYEYKKKNKLNNIIL